MNFNYTIFLVIIFEKKCKCVAVMLENKCKCVSILKINYVGAAYIKDGKKGFFVVSKAVANSAIFSKSVFSPGLFEWMRWEKCL